MKVIKSANPSKLQKILQEEEFTCKHCEAIVMVDKAEWNSWLSQEWIWEEWVPCPECHQTIWRKNLTSAHSPRNPRAPRPASSAGSR